MTLTEIKKNYPDHISLQEAARLTETATSKLHRMIKFRLIKPVTIDRVRLTYYLLSPEDVAVINSYKNKTVKDWWIY